MLEKLEKPDSGLGKALQKADDGIEIAQDLAGKYNKIAEWCGLPVVPSLFLKKE
jgi:hypothetical protein